MLSVPGSQKHRIAPDESGFEGLVLAGDWTRTGYDLGCIEAATMSGLMAAKALGAPVSIVGEVPRQRAEPPVALPRYVDRPGEMALRAPYMLEEVSMTALVLTARQAALGSLIDRYLNIPARGHVRYVPAAPFVVLAAAFAGRAYSGDPEHRRLGYMPETDVAFWVPAWAMRPGKGGLIPERLVWFLPHVFVSSGAAAAAGREIYGFPKSVVELEARHSEHALDHLSVMGEVLARHTPETCGTRARILEVSRSHATPGPLRSAGPGARRHHPAARPVGRVGLGVGASLLRGWGDDRVPEAVPRRPAHGSRLLPGHRRGEGHRTEPPGVRSASLVRTR